MYQSSSTIEYEQLADAIDLVLERRGIGAPSASTNGRNGHAAIDGQLTMDDVIVSGALAVGFFAGGALIATTNILAGASWSGSVHYIQDFTRCGVYLGAFRLIADALDGPAWWEASFGRMMERLAERAPVRTETVYRGYYMNPPDEDDIERDITLYELPNGRKIEWGALTSYLTTAVEYCDSTDGKSWSRESWAKKMYDGYDNYGYLPARKWAGIKRLIDQVAGKYPAFRHLWRTNDAELVRQFIELLENPE